VLVADSTTTSRVSRPARRTTRGGLRAKLLAAPVVALVLMAAMGAVSAEKLSSVASQSRSMAVRTNEVEILRDSNSRQFESDRHMYLALHATDPKKVAAVTEASLVVLQEAADGYREFSRSALTPRLRAMGIAQADMMVRIEDARVPILDAIKAGRPVTPERLDALESKVDAADEANDTLVTAEQKVVDGLAAQSAAAASDAKRLVLALLALALVAAAAIAYFVVRGVMRGVRQVLVAAEGISEGDLDQQVDVRSRDEIGQMAGAFGRMIDYLKVNADVAARVADGDLSVEVTPRSPNDVLGNAFARMVAQLRDLAEKLSASADSLAVASQHMATTSEEAGRAVGEISNAVGEVAQGAERQVRAVEQAKAATVEVTAASAASATNARQTAEAAIAAREVADLGAGAVTKASEAMAAVRDSSLQATAAIRELGAKSAQIGGIVGTITGIAEQTNLLALNAAIEAARAGDEGRGFAVVADEVRKLAEGSRAAAASIAGLIAEIQQETAHAVSVVEGGARQTEDGVEIVEEARESFLALGASVQDMNGRVDQIAAAIQQIASASEQVQSDIAEVAAVAEQSSASTQQVSASTQETSASAQQIAASAQELARTADGLKGLVGQFTLA
jgi:methyl-accepting chemotaxis protein